MLMVFSIDKFNVKLMYPMPLKQYGNTLVWSNENAVRVHYISMRKVPPVLGPINWKIL